MTTILTFLKGQDAFGEPVRINYKGDTEYKTMWGATLTLLHGIFILAVTIIGVIDLVGYENPTISSVSLISNALTQHSNVADFPFCSTKSIHLVPMARSSTLERCTVTSCLAYIAPKSTK